MFSQEWESTYSSGTHDSIWPWSDLVSSVMRNTRSQSINLATAKVLELGCGAGANVSFFNSLGCAYHGVDGSPSVIQRLKSRFAEQKKLQFSAMDFTAEIPHGTFNIFVDRSSLTHNSTSSIKRALELCRKAASPDALFFGIDWFSKDHSDYTQGEQIEDRHTKANARSGQFEGLGQVHFSDPEHLVELFASTGWKITNLEHKLVKTVLPESSYVFAAYNLLAKAK